VISAATRNPVAVTRPAVTAPVLTLELVIVLVTNAVTAVIAPEVRKLLEVIAEAVIAPVAMCALVTPLAACNPVAVIELAVISPVVIAVAVIVPVVSPEDDIAFAVLRAVTVAIPAVNEPVLKELLVIGPALILVAVTVDAVIVVVDKEELVMAADTRRPLAVMTAAVSGPVVTLALVNWVVVRPTLVIAEEALTAAAVTEPAVK